LPRKVTKRHEKNAVDRHNERLSTRLAEGGATHYFLSLPWATHGLDFNLDSPGGQLADYAIDQFLGVVMR
jgi:hypothetical protein